MNGDKQLVLERRVAQRLAIIDFDGPSGIEAYVYKMRVALAERVGSDLIWITAMKPANAHLISVAIRDTGAVWATAILPADRPAIAAARAKAKAAAKDDESRNNPSAFEALLTNTK
jgi:hypothetical protein